MEKSNALHKLFMGLGWDPVKKSGFFGFGSEQDIDLDASCAMFAEDKKTLVDVVFFNNKKSKDNAILHSGDNLTGEGERDDEVISVYLPGINPQVHYLVFTITSYSGQTFNSIQNAFCRLVDTAGNKELARYTITGGGDYTGMIMAALYRKNDEWKMRAIGEKAQGRTVKDMLDPILAIL
ncbi:MAG: TerD family protein [Desulfovibrionaceae bacterium]|nr:TerD family protein [Desulfovibrionaceae bacterium]